MGKLIKVRGGFWWCTLFIVILLGMPWLGLGTEGDSRWTNGLYEAICILVCFPIIVATGDGYYESCILGPEGIQIEVTE